jgi:ribonuclease HI
MTETTAINIHRIELPPPTSIPNGSLEVGSAESNEISIYFDGSCAPTNPGLIFFGVIAFDGRNPIFQAHYETGLSGHNGIAEALALNRALDLAIAIKTAPWAKGKSITIRGDAQNCIKAINLEWKFSAEPERTLLATALDKRERLEGGVQAKLKASRTIEVPVVKIPDAENRAHDVAKRQSK